MFEIIWSTAIDPDVVRLPDTKKATAKVAPEPASLQDIVLAMLRLFVSFI